ncbi:nuclease-like protein [Streptomyces phage Endor1]|uniref:Nuclease-like protein n=1 Tax=Streptomyces phage Endor1 TaxID=2740181 RepID=A0A7G4AWV4_9CAUD|nr:endonuclease [Streptomyces phage Endor1]QMP84494.1 nuclease-like protein [Streptomyces phage Endor1]
MLAVKDGDTLKVQLDQGFGDTKTIDLRLYETWAPEKKELGGAETRAFVEGWLNEADPDGDEWPLVVTTIRVKANTHEVSTLGRYVGLVEDIEGRCLNDDINDFVAQKGYGTGIGK